MFAVIYFKFFLLIAFEAKYICNNSFTAKIYISKYPAII